MDEQEARVLDVLVKTYDDVHDAKADYETLRGLYESLGSSLDFGMAVIRKTERGKVKIEETYEAHTRHDALKGLGWGLAAGVVAAVFPPVGIAAAAVAGAAGGAAIGAIVGHVQNSVPRDELKKIAERLNAAESALIAVYETSLTDRVVKKIKLAAAGRVISRVARLDAEKIADEIEHAGA